MVRKLIGLAVIVAGMNLLLAGGLSAAPTSQPAASQPAGADSPRALLEKLENSFLAMDAEGIAKCTPPDFQKPMRAMMSLMMQPQKKIVAVRKTVQDKLGKDVADKLFDRMDMTKDPPLRKAVEDGKVNWDKVKITVNADKATVEIAGEEDKDLAMEKVGERWYCVPAGLTPEQMEKDAQGGQEELRRLIKGLDDFQAKVNAGEVTKDNAQSELDKCLQAAAGPPPAGPANPNP